MGSMEKTSLANPKPTHSRNSSNSSRYTHQNSGHWEVMEDINDNVDVDPSKEVSIPGLCEGLLMKKRKWPLNGWHKRYFLLEKGILRYAKTRQDILKGKLHGSLDVSLAVMSVNKKSKRIDLDAGHNLYHIKAKTHELFYIWVTKLSAHRLYKKGEAVRMHQGVLQALSVGNSGLPSIASLAQRNRALPDMYQSDASLHETEVLPSGVANKVSAWLEQNYDIDSCTRELAQCQLDLVELSQLVQRLRLLEGGFANNDDDLERRISMQNLTLQKPKKKPGKIWGHTRTLSGVESLGAFTSSHLSTSSHLGASIQSIPDYVYSQLSTPGVMSPEGKKIQQDLFSVSQRLHNSLASVHQALVREKERLRQAWTGPDLRQTTSHQLASLCTTLSELDVQSRLTKVHSLSLSSDSTEESFCTVCQEQPSASLGNSLRRPPSVADSMAEYFDASEVLNNESYSENEASDESGLSDVTTSNSEPEEVHVSAQSYRASISNAPGVPRAHSDPGRRSTLPAPCPDNSHIGLMTILYNNIGKDLSRVSMPAALNEPLCLMQRLCEELEYSDLLDTANHTVDPFERMVYIAAFAISGYAWAQYRNRYKPFNPVLGETFEYVCEDRGFHYVSEQVSHHPPISACHADSENFSFWQDQRWKNKFWGKSLEIIPTGMVNVTLPRFGDHYEWNKVVTCIHNVLSQQRWLEHYGEVVIRNTNSTVCTCKITFVKSRYWSSDSHPNEVQGQVLNEAGEVVHRFGGYWHEGIYCDTLSVPKCVWKPNPQPEDYYKYYGFSRFAFLLNELPNELRPLLPPTDTRFRPDQRLLEEGKVCEADKCKDEVEEKQRNRRKLLAKKGEEHVPRFFTKKLDSAGREVWVTNGTYWEIREEPGFTYTDNLDLWV